MKKWVGLILFSSSAFANHQVPFGGWFHYNHGNPHPHVVVHPQPMGPGPVMIPLNVPIHYGKPQPHQSAPAPQPQNAPQGSGQRHLVGNKGERFDIQERNRRRAQYSDAMSRRENRFPMETDWIDMDVEEKYWGIPNKDFKVGNRSSYNELKKQRDEWVAKNAPPQPSEAEKQAQLIQQNTQAYRKDATQRAQKINQDCGKDCRDNFVTGMDIFQNKYQKMHELNQIPDSVMSREAKNYVGGVIEKTDHGFKEFCNDPNVPAPVHRLIYQYAADSAMAAYRFVNGVRSGAVQGWNHRAIGMAQAVQAVAHDPALLTHAAQNVMRVLSHPEEMVPHVKEAIFQAKVLAMYGDTQDWGEALGQLVSHVVIEAAKVAAVGPAGNVAINGALGAMRAPYAVAELGIRVGQLMDGHPKLAPAIQVIERQVAQLDDSGALRGWKKGNHLVMMESANAVNARLLNANPDMAPPFQPGTQVAHFHPTADDVYARVHNPENPLGSWLMKREALLGLTPQQIQIKYSLPALPTHIIDVRVPAGTPMLRGRVGDVLQDVQRWNPGKPVPGHLHSPEGSVQYQLQKRIPVDRYQNSKPIGDQVK